MEKDEFEQEVVWHIEQSRKRALKSFITGIVIGLELGFGLTAWVLLG